MVRHEDGQAQAGAGVVQHGHALLQVGVRKARYGGDRGQAAGSLGLVALLEDDRELYLPWARSAVLSAR